MSDVFLFVAVPYIMTGTFIVGLLIRFLNFPFKQTSLSSQFLEGNMLFWGSFYFHWSIVIILLFHLLALILPWRGTRLWVTEITGSALGTLLIIGLVVLIARRLINPYARVVTRFTDWVVLVLLLVQAVSGLGIAHVYQWGYAWMKAVAGRWLFSLILLSPDISTVTPLPWLIKVHLINAFVIFGLLPYTRLLHLVSIPVGYITRPYQVVAWNRRAIK